jgi:hypothetical protein
MDISQIVLDGDTPGVAFTLPVFRFKGTDPNAPSVYIQAALHAGELPGTALCHYLTGLLKEADDKGDLRGDITLIPHANPIGLTQSHFGELQGRFDLGTRTNFNRDFPRVSLSERAERLADAPELGAVARLKRKLLSMALEADLMLDLHCDDESLQYAYMDPVFWPEAADLASALAMDAVFLSDGESTAFEEAVGYAMKRAAPGAVKLPGKLAVTLELRGLADVDGDLAKRDAAGLFAFLKGRGVIAGGTGTPSPFNGPVSPLDCVEMIRSPEAGTVLFHHKPGDHVKAGDVLATVLSRPGFSEGEISIHAPQDGLIVTRVSRRYVRRGGDLMKIACNTLSARKRAPGTLED